MKRHPANLIALPLMLGPLVLGAAAPAAAADDDGDEASFTVGKLFFQLNDSDGDLGIHALLDGEPWERLIIEDPRGKKILRVDLRGRLREQGLTEFKFESAEPQFDELSPEEFFARFPEGEYEIEGKTLDGMELENTIQITHVLPAPPVGLAVSGEAAPEDCDVGPVPVVGDPLVLSWSPVTESHPEIGRAGPVSIVKYEVDVDREEPPLKLSYVLSSEVTMVTIPAELFESGDEVKFQVLVGDAGGNETSSESCFEVE